MFARPHCEWLTANLSTRAQTRYKVERKPLKRRISGKRNYTFRRLNCKSWEKLKSESRKLWYPHSPKVLKNKKNHGFLLLLINNRRRCLLDKQDTHEMKIPISLPLVLWSESTISDYFPFYWFSLLYAIPWFARIKNVWSKIAVSERRKYALSFLFLSIFIQKILHQPQSNHLQCPHILSFL